MKYLYPTNIFEEKKSIKYYGLLYKKKLKKIMVLCVLGIWLILLKLVNFF